jgi:hypothetical protein
MAHELKNGISVVDWSTGDPEGDRAHLFSAYRDFLAEIKSVANEQVLSVFEKWNVKNLEIDNFPRIQIRRPQ